MTRGRLAAPGSSTAVIRPTWLPTLLWLQTAVPIWLARTAPDLAHFTTGRAPLRCPVPFVLTVHDTTLRDEPAWYARREQWLTAPWFSASVPRAAALIAVSNDTAQHLHDSFGPALPPIHVIPEAPAEDFFQRPEPEAIAAVRRRLGLGPRYWLHVGSMTTRKNVPRIVAAFAEARSAFSDQPPQLVLVGPAGPDSRAVSEAIAAAGVGPLVRQLGYVPETDLPALYASAELVILVSLHEGCGLPALEAMALGRPLVSSGHGALPEAHGSAARLVDPLSVADITAGLVDLGRSAELQRRLGAEGQSRVQAWRWPAVAARTVDVYEQVAAARAVLRPPARA
jgi:glycosyltransferase involved in cell wall biosynthesis